MRDKHIKIWLFVFVGTLTVASGAASFFAQQKTLYKGLEPLKRFKENFAQTSVLSAQTATVPQAAAQAAAPEIQIPTAEIPQEETPLAAEPQKITELQEAPALLEPVSSPCGSNEKPVIKNSQIAGCTKENLSAETCESQGRFTYTGEDRPGLLYGMCINCLTAQFAANDGKCK